MVDLIVSVSEFVALLNQTLEFAYPAVAIVGELTNFRVSKNKWIYFDLKDELASVGFFGTVYQLPGPLEDGLTVEVRGQPRLHPQYGFSVTVQNIKLVGEGSLKRSAALLEAKLQAEGLFDRFRKRTLPYPPTRIGLITSSEAAAYGDFMKVLQARWGGVDIDFIDIQVQGEAAGAQIVAAIAQFNAAAQPPEVLVITRGGGSSEDLQIFNTESVVRSIAGSRVPTLLAIGHERDVSLAELAADCRASTPSNAAELLVPDRSHQLQNLQSVKIQFGEMLEHRLAGVGETLQTYRKNLGDSLKIAIRQARLQFESRTQLLVALAPHAILARGYAIVRKGQQTIRSGRQLKSGDSVDIRLTDAALRAAIQSVTLKQG